MRIQQQQQSFLKSQEQLIGLKHQHLTLQEQLHAHHQTLQGLQEAYNHQATLLTQLITPAQLQQDLTTIHAFEHTTSKLKELLEEYTTTMLEVKKLQHKEKMLGDLYTIFSKELLLMVIQSNLPKIQDLMNAYLAQTVDYQLTMEIDKKSARTDNLELFVHISDQHGTRKVESLSGGQKVILKLVWMIAISFVTNAPMLFLDETINNLDADTVAKVADMIKNFIKTK